MFATLLRYAGIDGEVDAEGDLSHHIVEDEGERRGAGEILITSIDRDGARSGYDLELVERVSEAVRIPVVASGGAGEAAHLVDALARGADAVLVAGIVHDGTTTASALKIEMSRAGVLVRKGAFAA